MKQRQLAMRDPALAALMGGLAPGGDFGNEFSFGDEDFGEDDDYGDDFGDDDYGSDFGAAPVVRRPTQAAAMAAWKRRMQIKAKTSRRVARLDPNRGSAAKIERYTFTLSQDVTLGTATALNTNMQGTPDTKIRPQILTINAPAPGFGTLSGILMSNVNVLVGPGSEDMFSYNALGWGRSLDTPTMQPANRIKLTGTTTTFVPPGYTAAATFTLTASFKGPSSLAGGGSDD